MSSLISRFLFKKTTSRYTSQRHLFTSPSHVQEKKPVSKTRKFMKKYGYAGIGVYLGLGVIDLSLTMAAISVKGAQQIKEAEDYIIGKLKGYVGVEHTPVDSSRLANEKPSLTSLFVIAYGIHKTVLLPFRLSLTAAITPTVAKKLQTWGWMQRRFE